ncbi:hypothetical protein [Pseudoroseicyclus sp. CXY001]|uniref:hypothetical protein n=1 Tax=Pseudoroseicyclus sp. CXY001 TaxID=3242492 RepID=UPI00357168CC
MTRRKQLAGALASALIAGAAWGQVPQGVTEVSADLDGDGVAEFFTLEVTEEAVGDLHVAAGGTEQVFENIAWAGSMYGTLPWLELSPGGSLQIHAANDAIGRNRWHLMLTIAWRQGAYRVAGLTYEWRDTLNLKDSGRCDINLLTGNGVVEDASGERLIAVTGEAPLLADWQRDDGREGVLCGLW